MLDRYSLLQSGFLAVDNKKLIRETNNSTDLEFDAYILNKPYKDSDNLFFYHSGIENLISRYKIDQKLSGDFDFREQFILEFFDALSVRNLADWIILQNNAIHLSDLHRKFLVDMLTFISTGKREIQPENWDLLIDKYNTFNKDLYTAIKIEQYFSNNKLNYIPFDLPGIMQLWHKRHLGFADFIVTIGTIFGKRPIISNAK